MSAGRERTLLTGPAFLPSGLVTQAAVVVDGDRIVFAGPSRELPPQLSDAVAPAWWRAGWRLAAGLVDIHNHGALGAEFGSAAADLPVAVDHHRAHGTTSLLGSFVSNVPEAITAGLRAAAPLVAAGELDGIHLEGPFLSVARCGAQNPAVLRDPERRLVEEWTQAVAQAGAPGAIRQMTWAPERPGGADLPRALAQAGVIASLGHTDCSAQQAVAALAAARDAAPAGRSALVTHLFNGMAPMHHRTPGPIAPVLAAAARGEVVLELIGDGVHVAPVVIAMVFDLVGPDQIALITDALPPTGMPDGRYTLGALDIDVVAGAAMLADRSSIAGSTATLLDVVRFVVTRCGVAPADALRSASATPAAAVGLADRGSLAPGYRADILVLGDDLTPQAVMRSGVWMPREPAKKASG